MSADNATVDDVVLDELLVMAAKRGLDPTVHAPAAPGELESLCQRSTPRGWDWISIGDVDPDQLCGRCFRSLAAHPLHAVATEPSLSVTMYDGGGSDGRERRER